MKGEHRRTSVVWGQKYSVRPCRPAGKDKRSMRLTWRCSAGARWPAGAELGWAWRRLPCCSRCRPLLCLLSRMHCLGGGRARYRQDISVFSFVLFIHHQLVLCPLINKAWDAGEDGERRQYALR